jgi:hypothetical protein
LKYLPLAPPHLDGIVETETERHHIGDQ